MGAKINEKARKSLKKRYYKIDAEFEVRGAGFLGSPGDPLAQRQPTINKINYKIDNKKTDCRKTILSK